MAVGTLTYLSGSQSITGDFGRIYAITDSLITVSGSAIGNATFLLNRGTNFESLLNESGNTYISNKIQYVSVNNTYGFVLVQRIDD